MIIKTNKIEQVIKFLNTKEIVNLNTIGFIHNNEDAEILVDDEKKPSGVIARKGYFSYIYTENDAFLNEAMDKLYKKGEYGFAGIYRPLAEKIKKRYDIEWENKCALYYYPKKEAPLNLISRKASSIKLQDAHIVNDYYTYKSEYSLYDIKECIEHRPTSAVYIDGDLASWVLMHNDNSMGIMYTKEKYRKMGFAVDVTVDLVNKILNTNKTPYLQIAEDNSMSPGLALKCGFIHENLYSDWFGILSR